MSVDPIQVSDRVQRYSEELLQSVPERPLSKLTQALAEADTARDRLMHLAFSAMNAASTELPSAQELVAVACDPARVLHDDSGEWVRLDLGRSKRFLKDYVNRALAHWLADDRPATLADFSPDSDRIIDASRIWFAPTLPHRLACRLFGGPMILLRPIQLGNAEIRRPEDVISYLVDEPRTPYSAITVHTPSAVIIDFEIDPSRSKYAQMRERVADLEAIVTALRIESHPELWISDICISPLENFAKYRPNVRHVERLPHLRPPGGWSVDRDVSDELDVAGFQGTFDFLRSEASKSVRTPVHRWNLSQSREGAEDEVIDLVVALESMLLPSVEHELRYRLSLRAATLLRDCQDPSTIFRHIRRLYDVRSAIVHKGASLGEELKASEKGFLATTREVVRLILARVVASARRGKSPHALCESLDEVVITGLRREM